MPTTITNDDFVTRSPKRTPFRITVRLDGRDLVVSYEGDMPEDIRGRSVEDDGWTIVPLHIGEKWHLLSTYEPKIEGRVLYLTGLSRGDDKKVSRQTYASEEEAKAARDSLVSDLAGWTATGRAGETQIELR